MTSIKLKMNSANFLNNIENIFTDKECVLAELVQNARRAGASQILFDYDNGCLSVRDNGCGVSDIATMFTIAESGWKSETHDCESPFGFGFISTIFCCEAICIVSGNQYLSALTEDVKRGESIDLRNTDNHVKGMQITMHDFALSESKIKNQLENIALIAEIKVMFNGEELDCPLRDENLHSANYTKEAFDFGVIYYHPTLTQRHCVFVLENFQDDVSEAYCTFLGNIKYEDCNIVKLDPRKVKARMPDRQGILNSETISKAIADKTVKVIKQRLSDIFSTSDDAVIVNTLEKYSKLLKYRPFNELLNNVDFLPLSYINPLGELYPSGEDKPYGAGVGVISRDELSKMNFVSEVAYEVGDSFLLPMYCYLHSVYELNADLDPNHWMYDCIQMIEEESLSLKLNDDYKVSTVDFNNINYCKSYTIDGPLGHVSSETEAFYSEAGIIFPDNECDAEVYKQIYHHDYEQENTESIVDAGIASLYEQILLNQTDDAAVIVQRCLSANMSKSVISKISGKNLTFSINEKGQLIVTHVSNN